MLSMCQVYTHIQVHVHKQRRGSQKSDIQENYKQIIYAVSKLSTLFAYGGFGLNQCCGYMFYI